MSTQETNSALADSKALSATGLPTPRSSPEPETEAANNIKDAGGQGGSAGPIRNYNNSDSKGKKPYDKPTKRKSKGERLKEQERVVDEIMKCEEFNYRGILGIPEKGDDVSDELYKQLVVKSFERRAQLTNPAFNSHASSKAANERLKLAAESYKLTEAEFAGAQSFDGNFEDAMELDDIKSFYKAQYEDAYESLKKFINGDKSARKDINKVNAAIRARNDDEGVEDQEQGIIAIQEIVSMNLELIALQQEILASPNDAAKSKYQANLKALVDWNQIRGYPQKWIPEETPALSAILRSGGGDEEPSDVQCLYTQAKEHVHALVVDSKNPGAVSALNGINEEIKKWNRSGKGTTSAKLIEVDRLIDWIEKVKGAKADKLSEATSGFKDWLSSEGYPLSWILDLLPGPIPDISAATPAGQTEIQAKQAEFSWKCGRTSNGQRIVAGWKRASRAVVEEIQGNQITYSIKDEAACGYTEFQEYINTPGILLVNGEQQRVWRAADRDGYEDFLWSATAKYHGGKVCPWNVSCIQWRGNKHLLVRSNLHRLLGPRRADSIIQEYSKKVGKPTPWEFKKSVQKPSGQTQATSRQDGIQQISPAPQSQDHDDSLYARVAAIEKDSCDIKKQLQDMSKILNQLADSLMP